MPILSPCCCGEGLEIRAARHGAVVVHDLDDHRGRLETRESREIAAGLGMSRARQHAAGLRHQRKDVPGLTQIFGPRVAAHGGANRVRAVVRRDAGRHALGGFDRQREVGAMLDDASR